MPSSIVLYTASNAYSTKTLSSLALTRGASIAITDSDRHIVCVAGDTGATGVSISYTDINYDSHVYASGDTYTEQNIGSSLGDWRWAYRFSLTQANYVSGISLYISTTAASGTVTIELMAVDGNGNPTGSALATRTVNSTSIPAGNFYKFSFATPYFVEADTPMVLCWKATAANPSQFRAETGATDMAYVLLKSMNSGSTWAEEAREPYFYIHVGQNETLNFVKDAERIFGTNVTAQVWSAPSRQRAAGAGGGNISVNFSGVQASAACSYLVRDVNTSGSNPFDLSSSNTGSIATTTSGSTGQTNQPYEALIAMVGIEGPGDDSSGSWSAPINNTVCRTGTTGGGAAANITITAATAIVGPTGTYGGTHVLNTARDWSAVIATYKLSTGITITPAAIDGSATAIDPFVPVPLSITPAAVFARAYTLGTIRDDTFVIPSAVSIKISATYQLYRRVRIGWARLELDISGVIRSAQSIAKASALDPTVILGGSIVVDLSSVVAYAVAAIGQPFVPTLATYALRRWNGTEWVDEQALVYDGAWVSKPINVWLDDEWKVVG